MPGRLSVRRGMLAHRLAVPYMETKLNNPTANAFADIMMQNAHSRIGQAIRRQSIQLTQNAIEFI